MADDFIPEEPLDDLIILDGRIDDLGSRISELESKSSAKGLSAEDEYNLLLRREVRQRIRMRYAAVFVAVIVIALMAWFAYHVLSRYFLGAIVLVSPSIAIALFVAPIVSISTVTIMLMIGAFRRFKDDDIEQVNAQAVIEAAKAASGN